MTEEHKAAEAKLLAGIRRGEFSTKEGFMFLPLVAPIPPATADWDQTPRHPTRGMPILAYGWVDGTTVVDRGMHSLN